MQKHTKIYLKHFNYCETDVIMCEIPECQNKAVDINHIDCKGMGGSKTKDYIENIMAMCRECHVKFGDKKQYKQYLTDIHNQKLNAVK